MISQVALQAKFLNADGTAASGTLSARLSSQLYNDEGGSPDIATTAPISGLFDAQGRLIAQNGEAFILGATDDLGTLPVGAYYTFTLMLDGAGLTEWKSPLPCQANSWDGIGTATVVDASAEFTDASPVVKLIDTIASESVIGLVITSSWLPGGTTVVSVDSVANTLTLSENATSTATGLQYTTGTFPLTTLMENSL